MNVNTHEKIADACLVRMSQYAATTMQAESHPARVEDERGALLRHDMINCLMAMRLRLELMRRQQRTEENQLSSLAQSVAHMLMLVQDWRELSQANAADRDYSVFDLVELVQKMVESNRPYALLKEQSLTANVPGKTAFVAGHVTAIQRAVDNLISNALKYTPEGGTVAVMVIVMDDTAIISVQDNGMGIPEAEQELVFQAHYRAKNAMSQDIPGTGLGLAQVKEAVEQHSGQIFLRSRCDWGTQVEVYLPLVTSPVSMARNETAANET
jgi:signal transduction histidine kinase